MSFKRYLITEMFETNIKSMQIKIDNKKKKMFLDPGAIVLRSNILINLNWYEKSIFKDAVYMQKRASDLGVSTFSLIKFGTCQQTVWHRKLMKSVLEICQLLFS